MPEELGNTVESPKSRGGLPRPGTAAAVGILAVLAASYVVNSADRQVFPVLVKQVSHDYHFSLAQGGLLATVFTLGIGLSGVPTGRLLDRMSRKKVMLIGIVIYSAFTVLTAESFGFPDMLAYRTFSGVGESLQNAALFSAVGAFFYTRRSLALGVLNMSYGIGSTLGPLLGAYLSTAMGGWRAPLYIFGGAGFVFVIVILLGISKRYTETKERPRAVTTASPLPRTLLNHTSILLCVVCVIAGLSLYSYLGLYPTFLQNQLHFSVNQAGLAASLYGIGAMVASVPSGYLGDRFGNRAMIFAALAGTVVVGLVMFTVATSTATQAALSFLEGAFGSGLTYVNLYAWLQKSLNPALVGRASGAFVTWFYLPSAVAGYVFSELVGRLGWGGAAAVQLCVLPVLGILCTVCIRRPTDNTTQSRRTRDMPAVATPPVE
jgi:MFS family permease